eukprot:TRINITY_DN13005_c1_g1_i1.p1 TRINITY_DN13005_c1_g1~~TRINITY_DN13005_c1_g1_i1.p1  ORF type:complete len:473 (+),score=98.63 TRINITY_DN13005_c1_g1_i1:180-1598(+)
MAGTAVIQGLKLGLGASSLNLGLGLGYKLNQAGQKDQLDGNSFKKQWTESDDVVLKELVKDTDMRTVDWRKVAAYFEGWSESEVRSRWGKLTADDANVLWSVEEDLTLLECYSKYGAQWTLITKKLNLLPGRTPREAAARWNKLLKVTSSAGGCQNKIEHAIKVNHAKEVQRHNKKIAKKEKAVVQDEVNTQLSGFAMMDELANELDIKTPEIDAEELKGLFTFMDETGGDDVDSYMLATPQDSLGSRSSMGSVSSSGSVCSSASNLSMFPTRTPSLRTYSTYTPSYSSRASSTRSSSPATPPLPDSSLTIPPPPSASTKMSQTVQWLLNGPSQPAGAAIIPTYVFRKSRLLSGLESAMPKNCLTVSPEMRMDLTENWFESEPKISSPAEFAGHVWMASLEPYKCLAKSFFGIREYTWLASTFNKKWCPWLLWSARMDGLSPPPESQSYLPSNVMQFWKYRVSLPFFRERAL